MTFQRQIKKSLLSIIKITDPDIDNAKNIFVPDYCEIRVHTFSIRITYYDIVNSGSINYFTIIIQ